MQISHLSNYGNEGADDARGKLAEPNHIKTEQRFKCYYHYINISKEV